MSDRLYERIYDGRLERDDIERLLSLSEGELFRIADDLRRSSVGDVVTYVVNRNINFTNRCIGNCKFCAFREDNGYILSQKEILLKVERAEKLGITEICLQGGLIKGWGVDQYVGILDAIKSEYPEVHLHAFSPMEVLHAAKNSKLPVEEVLSRLKSAGLGSMPGTAAEILSDRVRAIICPGKLTSSEWIEVVMTAHRLGIPTTATMMFGHVETERERLEHIFTIKEIQDETGGFTEFVPLPFVGGNTELESYKNQLTTIDQIKVHALARIILHRSVRNIQASWVKLGPGTACMLLLHGVNDLGGTLIEENISRSAGSSFGEYMPPDVFDALIRSAGRIPKQRTTLYEILSA
ncbi:MAG: FO synthase, subunit 2-like protein [Candidatus Syntrophoarchaeum caldarius]|uniref:5-amino-6-(D-ribitylamino)uracil--L-tyrosine 4-hydroxyphenyl transferase n=1 Tax=Candidatus Syntropharchaeum caldarium TaxID=1838285 RepID=A0A1F2P740_9EURY|nr:MAG: FO synthase, subunit 2-like protein [Candidatus Syntrophoarchaeum caldarius]